jgi:polyphosphate kinase
VIDEGLNVALRDNTQAWVLQKNGAYRLLRPTTSQQPSVAQNDLATKLGQPSDATAT